MKDYYLVFALTRSATPFQIRERYLELAKELHPDKPGGNAEAFKLLQEAYSVLGDPAKRREYNMRSKVREFVPKPDQGGALDLVGMFEQFAVGRVPDQFVKQVAPVLERKLGEHGVKARWQLLKTFFKLSGG